LIHQNAKYHTTGNQPTTQPLPSPIPFHISNGRFAIQAYTGYPFCLPNVESSVLSEYNKIPIGFPIGGSLDYSHSQTMHHEQLLNVKYIPEYQKNYLQSMVY
jgi:hypothetical protein